MADWHAVRTRPGAEGRAVIAIGGIGLVAYLPIEVMTPSGTPPEREAAGLSGFLTLIQSRDGPGR